MFSNAFYITLQKVIPLLVNFGVTNYQWNAQNLQFIKLYKLQALSIFNITFIVCWITFLVVQITRYLLKNDLNNVIFLCTLFVGLNLVSVSFILTIAWSDALFPLLNSFLVFFRNLEGNQIVALFHKYFSALSK